MTTREMFRCQNLPKCSYYMLGEFKVEWDTVHTPHFFTAVHQRGLEIVQEVSLSACK